MKGLIVVPGPSYIARANGQSQGIKDEFVAIRLRTSLANFGRGLIQTRVKFSLASLGIMEAKMRASLEFLGAILS